MTARRELPGIYFDVRQQPAPDALPRMDIAGFVGFAERGPLNLPVPVEDVGEFRDLFGSPLRLAWDADRRRWQHSHLHACVEAFFLNGGVRCWVVRVADPAAIVRITDIPLPGLFTPASVPAICQARSPGAWARDLEVATRLRRERLLPQAAAAVNGPELSVTLASPAAELVIGDLLELDYADDQLVAYLAVTEVVNVSAGSIRATGQGFTFSTSGLAALPTQLDLATAIPALTSAPPVTLSRLTFDVLSYRGELLEQRLDHLGFAAAHPRFWATLPTDETLFQPAEGVPTPPLPAPLLRLREQARIPRFPFAGPQDAAQIYLPLSMSDRLEPRASRLTVEPLASPPSSAPEALLDNAQDEVLRLPEAGLGAFALNLFVDPDLFDSTSLSLIEAFKTKAYRDELPVSGMHSLLGIEEVSIIAVPDAVHTGWQRGAPQFSYLAAPALEAFFEPALNVIRLTWSEVGSAQRYRLQVSTAPDFSNPEEISARSLTGDDTLATEALYPFPKLCLQAYYFRVRAETDDLLSAWSNERGLMVPESEFALCREASPALDIVLNLDAGPGLTWQFDDPLAAFSPSPEFELQRAEDPQFLTGRSSQLTEMNVALNATGVLQYFHVRVLTPDPGPWSNTVVLEPAEAGGWLAMRPADFDTTTLLGLHANLVRLCAARADAVALLSLPRHMREDESMAYLNAFIGQGNAGGSLPPLSAGEQRGLTYAALFHGWVATRDASGQDVIIDSHPPDGYVAGVMAARTLDTGAWLSPANVPLVGAVALEPAFVLDQRAALTAAGINVLAEDARGFLWLSSQTLGTSLDVSLINVRRLLILLRRLALREGRRFVFEPMSLDFRGQVRAQFEGIMSRLHVRGAFRGASRSEAYRVSVSAPPNTQSSLALGRFIIELSVAPSAPLEFLRVRLVQSAPERLTVEELS